MTIDWNPELEPGNGIRDWNPGTLHGDPVGNEVC
jgi:hypothetical protein